METEEHQTTQRKSNKIEWEKELAKFILNDAEENHNEKYEDMAVLHEQIINQLPDLRNFLNKQKLHEQNNLQKFRPDGRSNGIEQSRNGRTFGRHSISANM